jgi:hypothetical protein
MTCRLWVEHLDAYLDGHPTPAWQAHARSCSECAARLRDAQCLSAALHLSQTTRLSSGLADRITAQALAEFRSRQQARWRGWVGSAALVAAGLALVVGLRQLVLLPPALQPLPQPGPVVVIPQEPPAPEPADLRDNLYRAREAVAALTARTAGEAVETTLWPMPGVELPAVEMPPTPTLEPIRSAGEQVTAGLTPVTGSARRAMTLFFRDLPLARPTPVE